jgi:monothiol glutaredoxin
MNVIMGANRLKLHNCSIITSLCRAYASGSAENIEKLVKKNRVVVFMKGIPEEPRCGFSNAVVQIFRMHGVTYDAHDVLKDEELRQGVFCTITGFV